MITKEQARTYLDSKYLSRRREYEATPKLEKYLPKFFEWCSDYTSPRNMAYYLNNHSRTIEWASVSSTTKSPEALTDELEKLWIIADICCIRLAIWAVEITIGLLCVFPDLLTAGIATISALGVYLTYLNLTNKALAFGDLDKTKVTFWHTPLVFLEYLLSKTFRTKIAIGMQQYEKAVRAYLQDLKQTA